MVYTLWKKYEVKTIDRLNTIILTNVRVQPISDANIPARS